MYGIRKTGQFKKDVKLCNKRNYDLSLLATAMKLLQQTGNLPTDVYGTHNLSGTYANHIDAHIKPDWILIYRVIECSDNAEFDGEVIFVRTGTHSDIFKK